MLVVVVAAVVVEECEQPFKDAFCKTVSGGVKRSKDMIFCVVQMLSCNGLELVSIYLIVLVWLGRTKTWEKVHTHVQKLQASCVLQDSAFGCIS